jgi:putative teichuronic acid biosynthesis glycosyltransferase tuaC
MDKEICIITNGYPTKDDPIYAFIQPIAQAIADEGYKCIVIAPQSISNYAISKKNKRPYRWIDKSSTGKDVIIYQPEYISVSNFKILGNSISVMNRDMAVKRCFMAEKMKPDVLYAHFWDCGIVACKVAQKNNIPVFVATGESKIRVFDYYRKEVIFKYLHFVKGVVCVSTKNLEESRSLHLLHYNPKTIVLPNAVNADEFYKISKEDARNVLNINYNDKIAIFVGTFCNRKGVLRVIEAAEKIDDLKLILIGSGEQIPNSNKIIYSGTVSHDKIALYLNAADVFVLPTLAEGCCNAIIEAMACGLPIVSSDLSFNDDVLNNSNSIRINPERVDEIANAIKIILNNNAIKESLSQGALSSAEELTIEKRCRKILDFLY